MQPSTPKALRAATRLAAIFFVALALSSVVPQAHATSHFERVHAARDASLTVPTVSASGASSSSASGSEASSSAASPVSTTTTVLSTSSGSNGASTFTSVITTVVPSGSANSSSASGTTTSTAFPSLSTYSTCVSQCLQLAVSTSNCSSLTEVACYCASSFFTQTLYTCVSGQCTDQLRSAENLAQEFCNLETPSSSLTFPTSTSTTASSTASGSSTPSGNAAAGTRIGESDVVLGLLGAALGALLF
ncbi:hypothetical protein DFH11DRAFT_1619986 [Phellopilus nigrolimitatus]|nr:hypothetical protein DFH11DRAFT_1619986 [Phellopilus nigrolimitatus]